MRSAIVSGRMVLPGGLRQAAGLAVSAQPPPSHGRGRRGPGPGVTLGWSSVGVRVEGAVSLLGAPHPVDRRVLAPLVAGAYLYLGQLPAASPARPSPPALGWATSPPASAPTRER